MADRRDYRRDKIERLAERLIDVAASADVSRDELHAALGVMLYDMTPKRADRLRVEAFVNTLERGKFKVLKPVF